MIDSLVLDPSLAKEVKDSSLTILVQFRGSLRKHGVVLVVSSMLGASLEEEGFDLLRGG